METDYLQKTMSKESPSSHTKSVKLEVGPSCLVLMKITCAIFRTQLIKMKVFLNDWKINSRGLRGCLTDSGL